MRSFEALAQQATRSAGGRTEVENGRGLQQQGIEAREKAVARNGVDKVCAGKIRGRPVKPALYVAHSEHRRKVPRFLHVSMQNGNGRRPRAQAKIR